MRKETHDACSRLLSSSFLFSLKKEAYAVSILHVPLPEQTMNIALLMMTLRPTADVVLLPQSFCRG